MDTLTPQQRSERMSRVRSKDTRPERKVRSLLHALGYRFRLHVRLPGRPDIVMPRHRAVIFVHGCFWHRHPGCPNTRTPKSRVSFWTQKFEGNVQRDALVRQQLSDAGWRAMVVWECELVDTAALVCKVETFLQDARDAISGTVHGSRGPCPRDGKGGVRARRSSRARS